MCVLVYPPILSPFVGHGALYHNTVAPCCCLSLTSEKLPGIWDPHWVKTPRIFHSPLGRIFAISTCEPFHKLGSTEHAFDD